MQQGSSFEQDIVVLASKWLEGHIEEFDLPDWVSRKVIG
jgi:hypothetical protein